MSEGAIRAKAERLGFRDFSDLLRFNAPVGSRFPFHAHGDASLECQVAGSSRFYFLNQEPTYKHDPQGSDSILSEHITLGSSNCGGTLSPGPAVPCKVDTYPGDIVSCPKGKDGAHSVESLTDHITFLVANKEVVFDKMVIALFSNEGLGKENYAETINGAILEERILAAGALA